MKKIRYFIWICCALVMLSGPVLAADTDPADLPWKKAYLDLGLFYSVSNTTFRLGEDNIGAGIDEIVMISQGSSARQTKISDKKGIDAIIVGIIDIIEEESEIVYKK